MSPILSGTGKTSFLTARSCGSETVVWTLLAYGMFSVISETGNIVHTDRYRTQQFANTINWSYLRDRDTAGGLPPRKAPGASSAASRWMQLSRLYEPNHVQLYRPESQSAGLKAGRRVSALLSPLNLEEINKILIGEMLPSIQIIGRGYLDDTSTSGCSSRPALQSWWAAGQTGARLRRIPNADPQREQPEHGTGFLRETDRLRSDRPSGAGDDRSPQRSQ